MVSPSRTVEGARPMSARGRGRKRGGFEEISEDTLSSYSGSESEAEGRRPAPPGYHYGAHPPFPPPPGYPSYPPPPFHLVDKRALTPDEEKRRRKNEQSRARSAQHKDHIQWILSRPAEDRTNEENDLVAQYERRRGRKNERSKQRLEEISTEVDRIRKKPAEERTADEIRFLALAEDRRQRKNLRDKLRRERKRREREAFGEEEDGKPPHKRGKPVAMSFDDVTSGMHSLPDTEEEAKAGADHSVGNKDNVKHSQFHQRYYGYPPPLPRRNPPPFLHAPPPHGSVRMEESATGDCASFPMHPSHPLPSYDHGHHLHDPSFSPPSYQNRYAHFVPPGTEIDPNNRDVAKGNLGSDRAYSKYYPPPPSHYIPPQLMQAHFRPPPFNSSLSFQPPRDYKPSATAGLHPGEAARPAGKQRSTTTHARKEKTLSPTRNWDDLSLDDATLFAKEQLKKEKKNAAARKRAAEVKKQVGLIRSKPEKEWTEEERLVLEKFEGRRSKKNERSRARAMEKKSELDRILSKPEKRRTKREKKFVEEAMSSKEKKNQGDRLRRERIREQKRAGDWQHDESVELSLPSQEIDDIQEFPNAEAV